MDAHLVFKLLCVVLVMLLVASGLICRKPKNSFQNTRINRNEVIKIMKSGTFIVEDNKSILFKYPHNSKEFISEVWCAKNAGFTTETIGMSRTVRIFL